MSWNNILNQSTVKAILQKQIIENRIASAYLIHGIEGVGKDAIAIQVALVANCLDPIIQNNNTIEECGICTSCQQFHNLLHPNIYFIFPLPPGKTSDAKQDGPYDNLTEDQLATINKELSEKIKDGYYKMTIPNANTIRISSIRNIKKRLSLSQQQQGRRFVLIFNADKMTTESANALLKTLEEPPENTTFILTTSQLDLILPTIKSRCQLLHCKPLESDILADFIVQKFGIEQNEARLIANFSQGSYYKALLYLDKNIKELRELIVDTLKTSLRKKNYITELSQRIEKLTEHNDKNLLETTLSLLLEWIRDALTIQKAELENSYLSNFDYLERLKKFVELFQSKDLTKVIETIERSISMIRKNVQPQLILLSMFVKIRKILL